MMMTNTTATRRVATYERVSSEDQRDRETIKTQTDELARQLRQQPDVQLIERYSDDGISGTIPLAERPTGGRLMRDAAAGRSTSCGRTSSIASGAISSISSASGGGSSSSASGCGSSSKGNRISSAMTCMR